MSTVRVSGRDGEAIVVDAAGQPINDCARFLERTRVRGLSAHTLNAYAYDLALIHRWLEESDTALRALGRDDIYRFIAWEQERSTAPKSINRRLHTLRRYYRFVVGADLPGGTEERGRGFWRPRRDFELGLQVLPERSQRQLRVKEPKRLVQPMSAAAVRELLATLKRYRDLAIAHLMLLCGLRTQEVLDLRSGSIDFVDRRVRVFGKGKKERVVPLPAILADLLERYLALERPRQCPTDHVFVVLQGKRRGTPMTRAALRRVFRTRRSRPTLARAHPHRLRHTFGTDMISNGVRLPILQRMMGHATPDVTLQYIDVSVVDVAREFERALSIIESRYGMSGK